MSNLDPFLWMIYSDLHIMCLLTLSKTRITRVELTTHKMLTLEEAKMVNYECNLKK